MEETPRTDKIVTDWLGGKISAAEMRRQFQNMERDLIRAQVKFVERVNDDKKYLVDPICCLEMGLEDCQAELVEARAEIERLREYTTCTLESTDAEMDDKDIQIIKKDKLIEQLKKALESAKLQHYVNDDDNWYSCPASGLCSNDSAGTDCNCGADYVNSIIEAALLAAERGGE